MPKQHRKGSAKPKETSWGGVAEWYDNYLENTRDSYCTPVRLFYLSTSNKKARIGLLAEDDRDEFIHLLTNKFKSDHTRNTYLAALDSVDKYMTELDQPWAPKEVFMLLRAILTGSVTSPPLTESLVVFGKSRSLDRMRRFLETQKKQANQRK